MRFRTVLCLATLLVLCLAVASWSAPTADRLVPTKLTMPPDNQFLSGKISAIGDAAFSLEVAKGQEQKVFQFFVDDDTKIDGKLKVGSQAKVEYRSAEGNNIAVHVIVTSASGKHAR